MNEHNPLVVSSLHRTFGALKVTTNVNLTLERGARKALIGPNGAGKTTLVNLITGSLMPSKGSVLLNGQDITAVSQAARARLGLIRTFQVTRLFKELTVADNIRLAVLQREHQSFRMFTSVKQIPNLDRDVDEALIALGMSEKYHHRVQGLAYGEQRLLELAMALAMKPKVLLLDEPAAGVPKSESGVIMRAIAELPSDLAVLFIEHDMDLVFQFANRIVVLVQGEILTEGTPEQIASDAEVRRLYLGSNGHVH